MPAVEGLVLRVDETEGLVEEPWEEREEARGLPLREDVLAGVHEVVVRGHAEPAVGDPSVRASRRPRCRDRRSSWE